MIHTNYSIAESFGVVSWFLTHHSWETKKKRIGLLIRPIFGHTWCMVVRYWIKICTYNPTHHLTNDNFVVLLCSKLHENMHTGENLVHVLPVHYVMLREHFWPFEGSVAIAMLCILEQFTLSFCWPHHNAPRIIFASVKVKFFMANALILIRQS